MEVYMAQANWLMFLRKRMKVIFWITALVFITLVVFGWGAGVTGRSKTGKIDENVAGKVEDHDITYLAYQDAIQREYEKAYNENRAVSESESELIRDRTFYILVNQYLAGREIENKGVGDVTDRLVFESVRNDPPEAITQNPNFRKDGLFDRALFEEYLRNPQVDWLPVEMMVRGNLPFQRLEQVVGAMPIMTDLEALIEFVYRNELAKAEYIKFDPFGIEDIQVDTSDAAIEEYYEAHKEDYRNDIAAIVNHAVVPIIPTLEDTLETKNLAETLMVKLDEGDEFEYLAENYSDDPGSKTQGGVLGWFGKGQMVGPFEDAAFAADSGEIVGPVLTDFGYHIIYVLGKQGEGDSLLVYAAHILFSIEPGYDTEQAGKDLATKLIDEVEDGENFFEVCEALEIDSIGQSAPLTEDDPIPGTGYLERIKAMVFNADEGTIEMASVRIRERPLLEGIGVVQLSKRFESGVPSVIEIRDRLVSDIILEAHKKAALEMAAKTQRMIEAGGDMKTTAEVIGGQYDTTALFTRYDWVEGVGLDPNFSGTVFGLGKIGRISKPITTDDGSVYIVKLDTLIQSSPEAYSAQAMQIKSEIANFQRQNAYERWFANLRDHAGIIDNRFADQFANSGATEEAGETGETEE